MSYIQQFFTSRDNNANSETFVGQEGRLWWDPVTNQIYSSDGNTPGGIPLSGGGGGNGTPGGSNSQVQFNQLGNFGGSANLTFNSVTGSLTAVSFVGNGAGLTNITGANVTGQVANALVAGTVYTNAQPNITSVGTLTTVVSTGNISTTGNVSGNYFIGNGSLLTGIAASYGNSNVVANLAALGSNPISTTGNVTSNYFIGNGSLLTGIAGGSSNKIFNGTSYANIATVNGNVVVAADGKIWNFGTDGTLTLPAGAVLRDSTTSTLALGNDAGNVTNTQDGAIAIGWLAGSNGQNYDAVAIGSSAGGSAGVQGQEAVAIGASAGANAQSIYAVAIGSTAGQTAQGSMAVAVGVSAGTTSQGNEAVAVGDSAGETNQGLNAVAIGSTAGGLAQGNAAVAIGQAAGQSNQGINSVAIGQGAGLTNQGNNSIELNATGAALNITRANTFSVAPVRNDVANTGEILFYNNTSKEITYGNTVSIAGNITGSYFIGNGSALTSITGANITGTVANATYAVSAGSAATVTDNAQPNITSVGILTSLSSSGNITGANINTVGIVSAAGNVIGNYFVGNANVQFTSSTAPPAAGNLIGAQWYDTATDTLYEYQSDGTTLYWVDITGPVIGSNGAVAGSAIINGTSNVTVTADANTTIGVAGTTILTVASTGAIVAGNVTGGNVNSAGNINAGGMYIAGAGVVTGNLQIQGNLTYNNLTNITTANLVFGLANTSVGVSANGAGWVIGNTNQASWLYNYGTQLWNSNIGISAIGNIIGSNITTAGLISATGNITGNYYIGNGSLLTGIVSSYGNANVTTLLAALGSNAISSTANITTTANLRSGNLSVVGSINLGGLITATGNITGGNLLTGANVSAFGNVTGGNIVTGGVVTTVGNVVANYFVGNGAALIQVNGANVTGTVANATYAVSASTVTTAAQPNITSVGTLTTVVSTGNISTTGNITGNYLFGNGSQLTGLPATYGNANVVANLAALGSNPISTTGNVTAGYFVGNGSLLTGIAASSYSNANVELYLASGTNTSNIITTANISGAYILGNGSQLTGIAASYGNANVVANLAALGSNPISTTGNVTAGYLLGNGSALTSITGANVTGTVANTTYALSANSASSLVNGASSVILNSDGTMVFPSNIINTGANAATLWSTSSSTLLWRSPTGGGPGQPFQTTVSTNSGNATIALTTGTAGVGSVSTWTFNTANVVFPDATVQTTAYPGTATTFSVTGNVTGGNVIGTTGVLVGGTGGDLTMTGGAITGVGNITSNGIMAINAPGGITTTQASFDIVNATATTVNLGGSATAVNIGATTGTLTINNPNIVATQASIAVFNTTATAANIFGAASTIIMGAAGAGTLTLRNGTIVGSQATQNLFNTVATTVNFAGAANTLAIAAGATPSGTTKTIGIGENGVANSITNINFGTATGNGNVTFSANTLVRVANTSGTALSVAGNVTGGNILSNGQLSAAGNITGARLALGGDITTPGNIGASYINGAYYTGTWSTNFVALGNVSATGNVISGNILTSGLISATGNITGGNILGGANVNSTLFTGTTASLSGNVTGDNVIAISTVYGNAATAFVAGSAAISGVALQMPSEGALRNLTNGLTNMYFDVSIGGTTQGQFQFRSSSSFTNVLTMSPTAFNVNTEAVVTAKTASFGRLPWNSAIDTELTIDDYRWRITNSGGIYPQVISNTGGTKNSAWTAVAAISGSAITQGGSTGILLPNNSWTTLYTFGSMASAGDTVTVTFQDKSQGRIYRVTFMRSDNGSTTGYNIIAERLI